MCSHNTLIHICILLWLGCTSPPQRMICIGIRQLIPFKTISFFSGWLGKKWLSLLKKCSHKSTYNVQIWSAFYDLSCLKRSILIGSTALQKELEKWIRCLDQLRSTFVKRAIIKYSWQQGPRHNFLIVDIMNWNIQTI